VTAPSTTVVTTTTTIATTVPMNRGSCHSVGGLPDPACTPGAIDPRMTQANIESTNCRVGYTASVRPPAAYAEALKQRQMGAYRLGRTAVGIRRGPPDSARGGRKPDRPAQPLARAEDGPGRRNGGGQGPGREPPHQAVCEGTITLAAAQAIFMTDWRKG
jgi:hypothetical protein